MLSPANQKCLRVIRVLPGAVTDMISRMMKRGRAWRSSLGTTMCTLMMPQSDRMSMDGVRAKDGEALEDVAARRTEGRQKRGGKQRRRRKTACSEPRRR